jgi:hypothetical protein
LKLESTHNEVEEAGGKKEMGMGRRGLQREGVTALA